MTYTMTEEQFENLKKLSRDLRPDLDLIDMKADIWRLIDRIESRAKADAKRERSQIGEDFHRIACSNLENYLVPPKGSSPNPTLKHKMIGAVEEVSKFMETKLTRMDRNAFIRRLINKTLAARKTELNMALSSQKRAEANKAEIEDAISDLERIFQG